MMFLDHKGELIATAAVMLRHRFGGVLWVTLGPVGGQSILGRLGRGGVGHRGCIRCSGTLGQWFQQITKILQAFQDLFEAQMFNSPRVCQLVPGSRGGNGWQEAAPQ